MQRFRVRRAAHGGGAVAQNQNLRGQNQPRGAERAVLFVQQTVEGRFFRQNGSGHRQRAPERFGPQIGFSTGFIQIAAVPAAAGGQIVAVPPGAAGRNGGVLQMTVIKPVGHAQQCGQPHRALPVAVGKALQGGVIGQRFPVGPMQQNDGEHDVPFGCVEPRNGMFFEIPDGVFLVGVGVGGVGNVMKPGGGFEQVAVARGHPVVAGEAVKKVGCQCGHLLHMGCFDVAARSGGVELSPDVFVHNGRECADSAGKKKDFPVPGGYRRFDVALHR